MPDSKSKNDPGDAFTQPGILHERPIRKHDVAVAARERGFDIGDDVMKERPAAKLVREALEFLRIERAQPAARAIPAGQIESRLIPGEDPRNRAQVREARLPSPARRPRAERLCSNDAPLSGT